MRLEEAIRSNNFSDERHRATVNLVYSAYWMKDILSSALKEYGLTMEQHNVLRILKGSHPKDLCVKDIASRIVEKSSNVPRIIDRLVAKKLVRRYQSKEDKRETLVGLTEKGIETIQLARKVVDEVTHRTVNLNEKEAATLNALLEKMREGADDAGK
ncbi:MarR family transcriptional regulator [Nemorincola caseinilytica]|uniref:MarR family transcriptional regulator n=1 Tax=Nemorincola caseinilytica TaxID=2054315 RepID=A0ABP8NB13_9BACT